MEKSQVTSHRACPELAEGSKVPPGVRPGATILELAVSIAIASIMFTILGAIFLAQGRFVAIHDAISETQLASFNALDGAGLYTQSARAIVASATVNGTAYVTGNELVILELPSIDASDEIIVSTYDYVAIGLNPSATNTFIIDVDADPASSRTDLTRTMTDLVDKVIFRYNAVDATEANAFDLYIRALKDARGSAVTTPVGRIYYLGSS